MRGHGETKREGINMEGVRDFGMSWFGLRYDLIPVLEEKCVDG